MAGIFGDNPAMAFDYLVHWECGLVTPRDCPPLKKPLVVALESRETSDQRKYMHSAECSGLNE